MNLQLILVQKENLTKIKIEYAKKYFELLNKDENITYDCVNSYEDLVHKILK